MRFVLADQMKISQFPEIKIFIFKITLKMFFFIKVHLQIVASVADMIGPVFLRFSLGQSFRGQVQKFVSRHRAPHTRLWENKNLIRYCDDYIVGKKYL